MKLHIIIFFIFFPLLVNAQGLVFDKEAFDKREELILTRATLPTSASLKHWTPALIYPQAMSDCVSHSFGMARTISMAKSLNISDRSEISLLLMSPWYMYYRLSATGDLKCDFGLNVERAADFVLQEGFVFLAEVEYPNYYPFSSSILCKTASRSFYPPTLSEDNLEARKLVFDRIYALKSRDQIKQAIAQGMPVVVGLMIPKSFEKCSSSTFTLSQYDKDNLEYGHAMTVVGYNDYINNGSFEILNSWGDDWGQGGFTYVNYNDFISMAISAYACFDAPRLGKESDENFLDRKSSEVEEINSTANAVFEYVDERQNTFNNSDILLIFDDKMKKSSRSSRVP